MSNTVKLSNGQYMLKSFGKYKPDLCFLGQGEVFIEHPSYEYGNRIIVSDAYRTNDDSIFIKPIDEIKKMLSKITYCKKMNTYILDIENNKFLIYISEEHANKLPDEPTIEMLLNADTTDLWISSILIHFVKIENLVKIDSINKCIHWKQINSSVLNLEQGNFYILRGKYFISKKNTDCFEIDPNGPHMLIKDSWGGAFNDYRGDVILNSKEALYTHKSSSVKKGLGLDWAILPKDWVNIIDIDDI